MLSRSAEQPYLLKNWTAHRPKVGHPRPDLVPRVTKAVSPSLLRSVSCTAEYRASDVLFLQPVRVYHTACPFQGRASFLVERVQRQVLTYKICVASLLIIVTVLCSLGGNISLTGVGLFRHPEVGPFRLFAPAEVDTRWNSIGYKSEQSQEISIVSRYGTYLHGFVFHESCWSVLEKVYNPDPVPIDRLYELCLSMPTFEIYCVHWGHNYGGLYFWELTAHYPWDAFEHPQSFDFDDLAGYESGESEASRDSNDSERNEPTVRLSTVHSDPYWVNKIPMILQEQPKSPPVRTVSSSRQRATADRFSRLPLELRSEIASHLPTTDFLNARLALRGLWDIFEIQQFWSTRFLWRGAERSWLFEAQHPARCGRDWRSLYRRTSDARASHSGGIRNRRRVWELALHLQSVLCLGPLVTTASVGDEKEDENVAWVVAAADIYTEPPEPIYNYFEHGCRILHRQRLRLTSLGKHTRVALSFIQVGEHSYLSSLRLGHGDGNDVQIGYRALTEQVVELDSDNWHGIVLAIGSRGILGLRFVSDNGRNLKCSPWYGRPEDSLRTHRLVSREPIVALKFGLDVSVLRFK